MKAIVYTEYGPPDVLHLEEVERPSPKDNELLIRNHATTVNYGDITARNFREVSPSEFNMPFLFWVLGRIDFGLTKPRRLILGSEFAGEIEAVGKDVKSFKAGDQVFGYLGQGSRTCTPQICAARTHHATLLRQSPRCAAFRIRGRGIEASCLSARRYCLNE